MALVIRMRQQGASSRQRFRIVVTDSKNPRDGKYTEKLGWYNPFGADRENYFIDIERLRYWVGCGAQVSDRVHSLVKAVAPEVVQEMTARHVLQQEKKRDRRKQK